MDVKAITFRSAPEYKHLENAPVAFFCAEYALDEDLSSAMYAGGLGVLAGDFILESADENLPFVAIGLWYGSHVSKDFSIVNRNGIPIVIEAPCGEEIIKAHVRAKCFGKSTYLLLLDTNVPENSPENKAVTNRLYDSNFQTRMKQEILLGIGGVSILHTVFKKLSHPDSVLFPITNGIFTKRWQAEAWHTGPKNKTQSADET